MEELNNLRKKIADLERNERLYKEAEKKLQAANQQLQTREQQMKSNQETHKRTQKIAHVGSWEWDVASDTVTWSDELFRIFRLNPEDGAVSYADHPKIHTPESMQLLDAAVQHTIETGEPYEIDLEIIRGDGTNAFCTVRGLAKKDKKGNVIQLFGSFQDITDRKNSEEQLKALNQQLLASEQQLRAANQQLQASEQQLRATNHQLQANEQELRAANQQLQANEQQLRAVNQQLEASEKELRDSKDTADRYLNIAAQIILCLDSDGNVTLLNDSGYQLLGYEVGDLIGEEWFSSCLPKEQEKEVRRVFEQLMKGELENSSNYESPIITKSGEIKTIHWHNTVLKDKNGKITGTLSSGEDITESIKTVQELAASEAFLKAIFDKSLNAILVADDAGNYITVNEAAANLFGYPIDKLLKMNVKELIKTNNPNAEEKYKQYIEEGKETGEIEFTTPNGEKKIAHYNAIRIRKDFNLSVLDDITKNKKAEQELRNSELKFQNIAENVPGLVLRYQVFPDGSDKLLFISKSVEDIYEIPLKEALNNVGILWKTIHPDDLEEYKKSVEEATKNLSYWKREHRILLPDGRVKWLQAIAVPIKQTDGSIIFDTLGVDITDQKKIEKDLIVAKERAEESEEKFSTIFNMSLSMICVADINTATFKFINPAFKKVLGYDEKELLSKPFLDFIHPDDLKPTIDVIEKKLKAGHPQIFFENRYIRKDGQHCHLAWNSFPLPEKGIIYAIAHDITEQKHVENELIKAKERAEESERKNQLLASILDYSWDFIGVAAPDQSAFYVNPAGRKMVGIESEEMAIKTKIEDYFFPEDLPFVNNTILPTLMKEGRWAGEFRFKNFKTNEPVHVFYDLFLTADPVTKKVINISTISRDITAQKIVENELIKAKERAEESERKLIEAQELSHVGNWEYIIDADTVTWSKELFNIFERSYDLPAPKYSEQREYYTEESFVRLDKALQECVERDMPYEIELDIITSSGNVKQIISKGRSLKDKNNKIIGSYGTAQDITEKKKIEQEIIKAKEKAEESEQRLKLASRSGKLGIWDWNVKENIMVWNKRMFQLYGVTKATFLNTFDAWVNGLHPEDKERAIAESNKALAGEKPFDTEFRVLHPDGKVLHLKADGLVLRDSKGEGVRMIGVNRDITENKLNDLALVKAKEKAEESDRLKSAFLANMSHEIRTPMNGILGFTNLLQKPDLTGKEQQRYIEIIEKSGNRMLNTINDIIHISRIESGLVELIVSEVNISEELKYLHSFFSPEASENGIKLIFNIDTSEQDLFIKTDREKFNSIVTNLIKNAIKFTNQGFIELGYHILKENGSGKVQFYVKDSGIGIPKHRQEAIFDRFVQADIENEQAKQGSGLGLAISKAYAEMLGGKMWVDSVEGKGSTFYFTIENNPVPKSESITINDEQILKENEISSKLKILVVEDDETSQYLISILLEKFTDTLVTVKSGLEAIEVCRNDADIDLILMDIQLPDMNGYEATGQIRQFNKDVVIIAQTAYALNGDREKATKVGCNDYISKPIDEAKLDEMVIKNFMN